MRVSDVEIISRSVVVVLANVAALWCMPLLGQTGFCRADGRHPVSLSNMLTSPNVACSSVTMWFAALLSRFYMTKGIVSQAYQWGWFRPAYATYVVASVGFVVFMLFPLQDGRLESPAAHTTAIATFAIAITAHFGVLNFAMHRHAPRPLPTAHYVSCVYTGLGAVSLLLCTVAYYTCVRTGTYAQITLYRPRADMSLRDWFAENAFLLAEMVVLHMIAFNTVVVHAAYVIAETQRGRARNIIYR